jgi:hypothetical protein
MNPENAPPPIPDRKARVRSQANEVLESWTAIPQPTTGISSRAVVSVTSLRVPMIGGSTIQPMRISPPERPGMAVSQ